MVPRPATDIRNGALGAYAIGTYRPRPASMTAAYEPPRAFIEARLQDYDILGSPNLRLGQFLPTSTWTPTGMATWTTSTVTVGMTFRTGAGSPTSSSG